MNSPVVVIGGGMGGLSAAAHLALAGARVVLLERAPQVGGKAARVRVGETEIDVGPTVLTMPWILEELWTAAGERLDEHLHLEPLDPIARHFWSDGTSLDLSADAEATAAAIERFSGPRDAAGYRAFVEHGRRIYETVEHPFLRAQRPSLLRLAAAGVGRGIFQIDPWRTLWTSVGRFFRDPRLRQLFARYATYVGSSALRAPATLNVIAEVERRGVYRPAGGMTAVAQALAGLCQRLGVEIQLETDVQEIEVARGVARGVRLADGTRLRAAAVVVNADVRAVGDGRFGERARAAAPDAGRREPSLSAITWALVGRLEGVELAHHNVFFSDDYTQELRSLFDHGALSEAPTIYACAQARPRRADEAPGSEPLLLLINAPPRGRGPRPRPTEVQSWTQNTFERLHRLGLSIRDRQGPILTTPHDFEARFPSTGGALYGPASHGWRASFVRQSARSKVRGLVFAGGFAHPGAGVPMAILSGMLASEEARRALPSTPARRPTGIGGGTWTSSATTASGHSSSSQ